MPNCSPVRLLSTKIPRPKDWKISKGFTPKPLVTTQTGNNERSRPVVSPRPPLVPGQTPLEFLKHRQAMKKSFPEGWQPPKKLTRDAMQSLRTLHELSPDVYTTPVLADKFKISPEAVRRILRSRWTPSRERLDEIAIKESNRRFERKKQRVMKEWTETVDNEVVESSESNKDKLELT